MTPNIGSELITSVTKVNAGNLRGIMMLLTSKWVDVDIAGCGGLAAAGGPAILVRAEVVHVVDGT